jgi:hypothetical protein
MRFLDGCSGFPLGLLGRCSGGGGLMNIGLIVNILDSNANSDAEDDSENNRPNRYPLTHPPPYLALQ